MGLLSVMDAILEVTMDSADAGAGIGGMGAVRGTGERLETDRRRRRLDVVAGSAMGAGSDEWGSVGESAVSHQRTIYLTES